MEVVMRDGECHLLQGIKHGMSDLLTRILLMTLALEMHDFPTADIAGFLIHVELFSELRCF